MGCIVHQDEPGEESPPGFLAPVVLGKVLASIFGLPVQAQDLNAFFALDVAVADVAQAARRGLLLVVPALVPFVPSLDLLIARPVSVALELDHGLLPLLAVVAPVELNLDALAVGVLGLEPGEFGIEVLAGAGVEIAGHRDDVFDLDVFLVGVVRGVEGLDDAAHCSLLASCHLTLSAQGGFEPLVPLGH